MGIIKKIILVFILVFTWTFVLKAQVTRDTITFDGSRYVKHIVKGGESLKSIANLHKVKIADILDNNETQKRLYYNQLLYIPIDTRVDTSTIFSPKVSVQKQLELQQVKDTSELNIALLMPYFLLKNDTMFNDFEDTTVIPNIYYKRSEAALSFHLGVKLAIDSLRKQGRKIKLYTFDTNKDSLKVRKIVASGKLSTMNIIVGPLYPDNFDVVCRRYGNDTTKVLISPLSKSVRSTKKYKAVYQIAPTFQLQSTLIKEHVIANYPDERVIILNTRKNRGKSLFIKNLFNRDEKQVEVFTIGATKVDSIRKIFKEKQVVIIPSSNKAFVSKMLGAIGGMDSTSIVFGMYDWKKYDNLDINNLMFLDVHFPDPYAFNYTEAHDAAFLRLFETTYRTNIARYSFLGYNVIMNFCSDYKNFDFKKLNNAGRINTNVPLHHYVNYELVPSK